MRYTVPVLFYLVMLLVVACGPQLQRPSFSPELVARERDQQRRLAAALQEERKQRLVRVFSKLTTYGGDFCEILTSTQGCSYKVDLKEDDTVNAGTDGSRIVLTTGMLRFVRDDNELAMVLGHELAHNVLGHVDRTKGNRIIGGLLGLLVDIGIAVAGVNTRGTFARAGSQAGARAYSQEFEMEADYLGLYFVARAGFDVVNAPDFWRRMGVEAPEGIEQNFEATHPSSPERFVLLSKTFQEIQEKRLAGRPLMPDSVIEIAKRTGRVVSEKSPLAPKYAETETGAKREMPGSVEHERSVEPTAKQRRPIVEEAEVVSIKKKEEPKVGIAPSQPKPSPAKVLYVKSKQANLYAQPGDYATVLVKLQQGETLTQLGLAFAMEDSLYKVQTQKGVVGWVRMADVSSKP